MLRALAFLESRFTLLRCHPSPAVHNEIWVHGPFSFELSASVAVSASAGPLRLKTVLQQLNRRLLKPLEAEDVHHFVAKVVDHLHRDSAWFGLGKEAGCAAVQRCPSFGVDFGLDCDLERAIGVVGTQEVGVLNEETFFVVIGVDRPAGDPLRAIAAQLARVGMEDVHAVHFHAQAAVGIGQDRDIRFAEDHEQVAVSGVLEVAGHVQVGIHEGLQNGDSAEFAEFRGVRFVVKRAGDQRVEAGVARLAGGCHPISPLHGANSGPIKITARFSASPSV